ncbi:MAG: DUF1574 family protein [Spirochaetales bacterium]|nr:DUF1574 family protein [Spirochaetales bacterium]
MANQEATLNNEGIETPQDPMARSFRFWMLIPVLILLAAFVLDKQLFIWRFPDYFLRTASYLSYEHKIELMEQLEAELSLPIEQRGRIAVMFGNSRTTSFSNDYIESRFPGWKLYNFSVPGGTSDYFHYLMQQFEERNIRPDFVFFAITPQGLNATPSIAMDEVMLNGLPADFMFENAMQYSPGDISNYVAKRLFWNYQYRPKLPVILERLEHNSRGARQFRIFVSENLNAMHVNRGSVPYSDFSDIPQDEDFLRRTAEGTWRDFLNPFHLNEGQVYFMREMVAAAERLQIPNAMVWVKVGSHLREFKATRVVQTTPTGQELTIRDIFTPIVLEIVRENSHTAFLDMNYTDAISCDRFYDSSHLAGVCFPEFTDYLFSHIESRL